MPSSGYGAVELIPCPDSTDEAGQREYAIEHAYVLECARHAMKLHMFIEWMESFIAAWEQTKDARVSANAGIIEWDM